jgi:hypothetical protein
VTPLVLGLAGIAFLAVGVMSLVTPAAGMAPFGMALPTPSAVNEIRANYGGMHLAMGAFYLWAAARPAWRRAALLVLALFTGGLVVGRLVSLAADGAPNAFVWRLLVVEAAGAAAAAVLLRRTPPRGESDVGG